MNALTISAFTAAIAISTLSITGTTYADNKKSIGNYQSISKDRNNNFEIPRNNREQRLINGINDMPDLIPALNQFDRQGIIKVKNIGNKKSTESFLSIDCDHQDKSRCAELPEKYKALYHISGEFMLKIPELNPGQTYSHRLPFWRDLTWGPGRYVISFNVDSTNTNRELNERNNIGQHSISR